MTVLKRQLSNFMERLTKVAATDPTYGVPILEPDPAVLARLTSLRTRFPQVTGLASTPEVAQALRSAALAVLLDPGAGTALSTLPLPSSGSVVVIVGPEGGLGPAEAAALTGAGAVGAHLGPTILRTSTAGVVAASVMLSRAGRWRDAAERAAL